MPGLGGKKRLFEVLLKQSDSQKVKIWWKYSSYQVVNFFFRRGESLLIKTVCIYVHFLLLSAAQVSYTKFYFAITNFCISHSFSDRFVWIICLKINNQPTIRKWKPRIVSLTLEACNLPQIRHKTLLQIQKILVYKLQMRVKLIITGKI